MNFLPALATWQFAVAGAVCAAGPVLLHLLNRRRFRVVEWGAMQFLMQALQRRRRIMQLRDLILLVLRTAAVLLFGLALSRPFLAARHEQWDAGQPVHAVLLIDNSLSMAYQTLDGTLLRRAVQRAVEFVGRLPVGSRISVVPLCGSLSASGLEPFDAKPFAIEALERVAVVDRSMSIRQAMTEARRATELVTDLSQRFVLFTDPQRSNWSDLAGLAAHGELPAIQLVDVSDPRWDNSWVADVRVPDGVADAETPTTIQVVVRHRGLEPRREVRVGLWVREQEVDSQLISFDTPDATRELTFSYTMREVQPEAGKPEFVPVKVVLSPDRLVEDDVRHLLVPVVAALPVVFVDQYGDEEDPIRNRLGETRHLRQLLAPVAVGADSSRSLIEVRLRRMAELDRDELADARLVVIAGVSSPGDKVPLLREYVEQGGQLLVAAGADFDPDSWTETGWLDGAGILPLPLTGNLIGALPSAAAREIKPLFLSYESLGQHPYFQLAGNAEEDLRDLYAEPFFFQAVQVDTSPGVTAAAAGVPDAPTDERPAWLLWTPAEDNGPEAERSTDQTADPQVMGQSEVAAVRSDVPRDPRPHVLARFTNETGPAYLIERSIGRGHVLFAASGLLSNWNTLPKTNAIVMFDRILRSRMQATLSVRNFSGVDRISVPLPRDVRGDRVVLFRPGDGGSGESLDTGFLRNDQVGVTIERPLTRGRYRLQAVGSQATPPESTESAPRWQVEFAVNGDESESNLEPLDRAEFAQLPVAEPLRWIGSNEEISLAGKDVRGRDLWWWLALGVVIVLVAEQLTILWSIVSDRGRPVEAGT